MKLKLLRQHIINGILYEPETILGDGGVPIPKGYMFTPYMEGLDAQGIEVVREAVLRAFGRVVDGKLLDDPPIPRPLEENQPVPHWPSRPDGKPYG